MCHTRQPEAGRRGRLSKKVCGLQNSRQPKSSYRQGAGRSRAGGKGHSTAYTGAPGPILTHLVTASGALPFPCPCPLSQALHRRGKATTTFRTLRPTPHIWWKQGARHALVQEKNREQKKRLVWSSSSWSGFPAASAAAIRAGAV